MKPSHRWTLASLAALAALGLTLTQAVDGRPAHTPAASLISPSAASALAAAGPDQEVRLELFLTPLADDQPATPPSTTTFSTDGKGEGTYTLNGRPATAGEMRAYAEANKRLLMARAADRSRAASARLKALVSRAGLEGRVLGQSESVITVKIKGSEAAGVIEILAADLAMVDVSRPTALTLTNATTTNSEGALEKIEVVPFAHAYNLKGQGIGVWLQEGNAPDTTDPAINKARLKKLTNDPVLGDHATLTTVTLQKTAPEAMVYYGHQPTGCFILNSILTQTNPPIYMGSHSWNWTDTTNGSYWDCVAQWDDFVYQNRLPMFFPSGGNENGDFATSPGRGYNVMGIGGYSAALDAVDQGYSGWLNPETGAMKPDVVTPGTCIAIKPGYDCVSGVSIATPIAAGFAANLMSASPFFLNQPQAIKAYLAAGATTDVDPGISVDGAGMVNFLHTHFYRSGKTWNGGNAAYFNANQEIFETAILTAGKRYRVAISWLVPGSYVLANKKPNMEMSLSVYRGTAPPFTSAMSRSNVQWVDFVAPSAGTYTIKIKRTFNAGVGNLALALTVGEVV